MTVKIEQAKMIIQTVCKQREVISLSSFACLHYVCAKDIVATIDSPSFSKSAMDGYAYKSNTSCTKLKVVGRYYAGDYVDISIKDDECIFVSTGCMLPSSVDCVIKFEDVIEYEDSIELTKSLKPYTNYIQKGEDYKKGTLLIPKNTYLTPIHLSILASTGISYIEVYKPLKIKILATGSELNEYNQSLQKGKIFNSTSIYLYTRLLELGITDIDFEQIEDDKQSIQNCILKSSLLYDVLITTGGVSVGPKDYIVDCIKSLDGIIHFHKVYMKPGMPTAFSTINQCDILSLSGNPYACMVSFEIFFREMMAIYMHTSHFILEERKGCLEHLWTKPLYAPRYLKAFYKDGIVIIPNTQSNGQILSMKDCNCLALIENNTEKEVKVYML